MIDHAAQDVRHVLQVSCAIEGTIEILEGGLFIAGNLPTGRIEIPNGSLIVAEGAEIGVEVSVKRLFNLGTIKVSTVTAAELLGQLGKDRGRGSLYRFAAQRRDACGQGDSLRRNGVQWCDARQPGPRLVIPMFRELPRPMRRRWAWGRLVALLLVLWASREVVNWPMVWALVRQYLAHL